MKNELDFFRRNPWNRAWGRGGLARLFDELLEPVNNERDLSFDFSPAMDIEENDRDYNLKFDIPGMDKDNIKVEFFGNQLIVSGERSEEKTEGKKNQRYVERSYGSFQRIVTLPQNVNADNIQANYHDGVLELTIPKTEESQPRQIKINEGKNLEGMQAKQSKGEQGKQVPIQ